MDQRTAELIALRKAAVEHTAGEAVKGSPIKSLAGTLHSALGAWATNSFATRLATLLLPQLLHVKSPAHVEWCPDALSVSPLCHKTFHCDLNDRTTDIAALSVTLRLNAQLLVAVVSASDLVSAP